MDILSSGRILGYKIKMIEILEMHGNNEYTWLDPIPLGCETGDYAFVRGQDILAGVPDVVLTNYYIAE